MQKLGRNDPCHCGSGLKYKKCCLTKDEADKVTRIAAVQAPLLTEINETMDWSDDQYRQVAVLFYEQTKDHYDQEVIGDMATWWNMFANDEYPVIRKPGAFAAALEYIMSNDEGIQLTQAEVGKRYGVTAATVSQRYEELDNYMFMKSETIPGLTSEALSAGFDAPSGKFPVSRISMEKTLADMNALLADQQFANVDEANAFLQQYMDRSNGAIPQRKPVTDADKARDLLFDAWDEPNPRKRLQLAQKALQLDPSASDAYNIMAEVAASSPKEQLFYYRQGFEAFERQHREDKYFEENKGHFWGMTETRPYMRALKGYADICYDLNNVAEAVQYYRKLLELNPNDNQGVRDMLLTTYIETEDWAEANDLWNEYKESGVAAWEYNGILIEYSTNGISPRLTDLISIAVKSNRHIPAYLQGRKPLPREMPGYYGLGDDNEAIIYAMMNRHLWLIRPELLAMLPGAKK